MEMFKALVERLEGHTKAMGPVELHGLLTGVALGPDTIEHDWLQAMLHSSDQELQDDEEEEVIEELALECIELLSEELCMHELDPLLSWEEGDEQPAQWVDGFIRAVQLNEEDWRALNEANRDAARCMITLSSIANAELAEAIFEVPRDQHAKHQCDMAPSVGEIVNELYYQYWERGDQEALEKIKQTLPSYTEEELSALDEQQLYNLIINLKDTLPREAVHECAERGNKIVPLLRRHLENECNWSGEQGSGPWWALLHAAFILGLIDTQEAADGLLDMLQKIEGGREDDLWDWVAGYWPALFQNKFEYVRERLKLLAEQRERDDLQRVAALGVCLAAAEQEGEDSLEQALDWLAALIDQNDEPIDFRTLLACYLVDMPRQRHRSLLLDLVKQQQDTPDSIPFFGEDEVERAMVAEEGDQPEWHRFDNPWSFYDPEEIAQRQQRWLEEALEDEFEEEPDWLYEPNQTITRDQPKIGRNDPCPCGSGKKFKKCCLH